METVLSGLAYKLRLIYVDDVFVIDTTFQGNLFNLRKVFQRVRKTRMKLNPEKCQHFQKNVRHFGHTVSPEWVNTDPDHEK
jgi:hypothetical protein